MKQLILSIFIFLFSCSDSYELRIEPETGEGTGSTLQKYRLVFNGEKMFPSGVTKRKIDPVHDKFEVTKIKFVAIKKWKKKNDDDNEWGQAGIHIRIVRKDGIFGNTNVIFEAWLYHFYNPTIAGLKKVFDAKEIKKIISINEDLDSGLGHGKFDNKPYWNDYSDKFSFDGSSRSESFYNSLIFKVNARKALVLFQDGTVESDYIRNHSIETLATQETASLIVKTLERCTIIFPYDSVRRIELRDF